MINIYNDLQELGLPVYAEGDAPQELPSEYYTVNEDATTNSVDADNTVKQYLYEYTLKWYTSNAEHLYVGLQNAITLLKRKGYIIDGLGYSNSTYKATWYSRQVAVEKLEDL